jgi:hypothetical protein
VVDRATNAIFNYLERPFSFYFQRFGADGFEARNCAPQPSDDLVERTLRAVLHLQAVKEGGNGVASK